jgi:hypothetical protein
MGERPVAALLLALLTLLAVTAPGAAAAQQQAPAGVLSLVSQSPWRQGDQPETLGLSIQTPSPEALEVGVSIFRRITTRSEFAQTLEGRVSGRPIEVSPVGVTDLPVNDRGTPTLAFTPTVTRDGVYPVRVELRPKGGGKAVDSFITYLVNLPDAPQGDPLEVAWVLPVHAEPAVQPDGRSNIDDARAEQLARLAAALERHPDLPFTAAVTPETAEALGTSARTDDRDTLTTLVRLLRGRELLGGPYVDTNLTSLTDAGLDSEASTQLTRGASTLRTLFGSDPTTTTRLLDERLSDNALAFLQSQPQPVDRLVVPETFLEPEARLTTETLTFALESRRGRTTAALADTALAAHFTSPNPALAANQLLADLATIYFDAPGVRRGVVVATPKTWEPSAPFLDAFLGGLAGHPVLRAVTLDQFFTDVPAEQTAPRRGQTDRTLVRRMIAPTVAPTAPTLPGASIRDTRRRIDAFASAVDLSDPVGAGFVERMDKTLLAGESSDLRPRDRTRYLEGAAGQLASELAGISMPQNRSITLTAREGEIPVTVTRRLAYPIRAVLRVESDTLDFLQASSRDLSLTRLNTTEQFTVRARSSGSFPLRVRVESPEGGLVLAESRFTVRSTAISGWGTGLSIGAAAFLLIWWGNHLRGRRSRRLVPAG